MTGALDADPVLRGEDALRGGDWEGAREAFTLALREGSTPEVEEGLGRALWWLRDSAGAIEHLERAYAGRRAAGDRRAAARDALWLAREFAAAYANSAVSAGWIARAHGLLGDEDDLVERGWLALARAERSDAPADMLRFATEALESARRHGDGELEAAALVRAGYASIALGDVESGTDRVDEAMAAATGGDVGAFETIGDVICVGIAACELATDWQRIEQWGMAVQAWITSHEHVAVFGFCAACCAEMFIASGRWDEADGMLGEGLRSMEAANQQARCVHPASKLAELRVLQGRLEEAKALLEGYEELPESTHALASLHLAREETAMAASVLHRRLNAIGDDNVLSAPFLSLLVTVQLRQSDLEGAARTVERLEAIARRSAVPRLGPIATFADGRVKAASGNPAAVDALTAAVHRFAELGLSLDAARARLELARALQAAQPDAAIGEAQTALAEFERVGAPREADAAAAFLRSLGVAGRTGPKNLGLLTRREAEVLDLLGEALSNAEIAARLFISTKTTEHHVSNVLAKLQVRTRTEAAAIALRALPADPTRR